MGQSFGGGTDIAAMHDVLDRLVQERWHKADVLLVSDGEWVADATLVDAVGKARGAGSRFHGVLIGAAYVAMEPLCFPIHRFADWTRLLEGKAVAAGL